MMISSEVFSKMSWLIENRLGSTKEFTEEQCMCIESMAEEFRETALYKRLESAHAEEKKVFMSMSPHEIYEHMLERIANAPVNMLAHASVVLLIPILNDRLRAERGLTSE